MSNHSPMSTLRELAEKALDSATKQLGQVRQSHQHAEQQLSMLVSYQNEYQQRLNQNLSGGIQASDWQNYQQFLQTLDVAVNQHQQQVGIWSKRLDQAILNWQNKQQRLNAYQTLHDRATERKRVQENRLDQKQMDEFAQRSAHRTKEL